MPVLQSAFGFVALAAIAWIISENRREIVDHMLIGAGRRDLQLRAHQPIFPSTGNASSSQ